MQDLRNQVAWEKLKQGSKWADLHFGSLPLPRGGSGRNGELLAPISPILGFCLHSTLPL